MCSAPYHARISSSIHMWSTRTSPTSLTAYKYMDSRCAANVYRQMYASGLLNFKATMATGCCLIFGILKLFMQPLSPKIPSSSYNHLVLIDLCRSLAFSSYFASCVSFVGTIFHGYFPESLYLNRFMGHKRSTDNQSPIHRSPYQRLYGLLRWSKEQGGENYITSCHIWIPFGDHPLKLERYRED